MSLERKVTRDLTKEIIYHYTTPESLIKILQKDSVKLHFTKYNAMNDKMEGKVLNKRYHSACNKLYEAGKIQKNERDSLLKYIDFDRRKFCFQINGVWEEYDSEDVFVCSFSLENDSLPMWNYYVKNGGYQGYNIGFQNPFIYCEFSDSILINRILQISEVIYSEDMLEKYLLECVQNIERPLLEKRNTFVGSLFHKEECFSHEKEVRLVYFVSKNEKNRIQYRVKNGILIPYIEVSFFKETIKEVTVGPLIEQELAIKNLNDFLNQNGYSKVKIKISEIPIRY